MRSLAWLLFGCLLHFIYLQVYKELKSKIPAYGNYDIKLKSKLTDRVVLISVDNVSQDMLFDPNYYNNDFSMPFLVSKIFKGNYGYIKEPVVDLLSTLHSYPNEYRIAANCDSNDIYSVNEDNKQRFVEMMELNENIKYQKPLITLKLCGNSDTSVLKQIDEYLEEIMVLFDSTFGVVHENDQVPIDTKTTWILASNHQSPYIIWGSGIHSIHHNHNHPLDQFKAHFYKFQNSHEFAYNISSKLASPVDIHYYDINLVIDVLLGQLSLSNSQIIPYLFFPLELQYPIILHNFKQLSTHLDIAKSKILLDTRYWYFKPYNNTFNSTESLPALLKSIKSAQNGIEYYNAYNNLFLNTLVISGFTLWIICTIYMSFIPFEFNNSDMQFVMIIWSFFALAMGIRAANWYHIAYIMPLPILLTIFLGYKKAGQVDLKKGIEIGLAVLWSIFIQYYSYYLYVIGVLYLMFSSNKANLIFTISCILLSNLSHFPLLDMY